jgi:hypothetical protein
MDLVSLVGSAKTIPSECRRNINSLALHPLAIWPFFKIVRKAEAGSPIRGLRPLRMQG